MFSSNDTNVHTNAKSCNSLTTKQGSNQTSKHASLVPLLLLPLERSLGTAFTSLSSLKLSQENFCQLPTQLFLLSSRDNVSLELLETKLSENKQASEPEKSAKHTQNTQASKQPNKQTNGPTAKALNFPPKRTRLRTRQSFKIPKTRPPARAPQNNPHSTPGRDPAPAPRPPRPKSSQKLQNSQPSENKKT
jgi:hypothetical protein